MLKHGRISGYNKKHSRLFIVSLEDNSITVYSALLKNLSPDIIERLQHSDLTGVSVKFQASVIPNSSFSAFEVAITSFACFDLNEAALKIIEDIINKTNAVQFAPPVQIALGEYSLNIWYKGKVKHPIVAWNTNPVEVIKYLKANN